MDWLPSVACCVLFAGLLLRWRSLGGRRPPMRFWIGAALQAPIWASAYYSFPESWILASWGLWLAVDGLADSSGRPALLGKQSETAVWALVISTFGWAGIDYLNEYLPVWTLLGFSYNPLVREMSVGLLGAPVVPTVLSAASLLSPDRVGSDEREASVLWRLGGAMLIAAGWLTSKWTGATPALLLAVVGAVALCSPGYSTQGPRRLLPLVAGAVMWAAFDAIWSRLGPAERVSTDYALPAALPVVLAVCAFSLGALYAAATDFLDKPRFDPFRREE